MEAQRPIAAAHAKAFVGRRIEVLVDGASEETEHLLVGRHAQQALEIDGLTYINDVELPGREPTIRPGDLAIVEVTEASDYDLVGKVVALDPHPARPPTARKTRARSALRVID